MKTRFIAYLAIILSAGLLPASASKAADLSSTLRGRILLQVESHGEAWYVYPKDSKRYYMVNGAEAYTIMRTLGIGITNKNLDRIKADVAFAKTQQGKIFLQVESHGEAYYIDIKGGAHYLKNGDAAYGIMRELGLGITNRDLDTIPKSDKDLIAEQKVDEIVPAPSNPEPVTAEWSGKASIVAPGMNKHAYTYTQLDFSHVATGTDIELTVQNGGGASSASVDLFPAGAVILSTGRQTDSICYIYDLHRNMSNSTICPIAHPGVYTLGMEGNWFSDLGSTNEITYKMRILAN
jgi:hypothetical protein